MTSLGEALAQPGAGIERAFNCPVHGDNHPSASVNIITGLWICYTCGAKGKVGDHYTVDPQALLSFLQSQKQRYESHYFPESWLNIFDAGEPHEYWLNRFSAAACKHFRLGYDPEDDAATYPLRDSMGLLLGVVRRPLAPDWDGPKYIYPKFLDVTNYMFNFTQDARAKVLLVEGAADAIACWEVGFEAFAIYGSRMSERQAQLLRRINVRQIFTAFDLDEAGEKAYHRVVDLLPDVQTVQIKWPEDLGKDVAELPPDRRRKLLVDWFGEPEDERVVSTTCESSRPAPGSLGVPTSPSTSSPGRLRIKRTRQ